MISKLFEKPLLNLLTHKHSSFIILETCYKSVGTIQCFHQCIDIFLKRNAFHSIIWLIYKLFYYVIDNVIIKITLYYLYYFYFHSCFTFKRKHLLNFDAAKYTLKKSLKMCKMLPSVDSSCHYI